MSIVEKALQKAQAKPERGGATERAAPEGATAPPYEAPASSVAAPLDGIDVVATATAMGRECRGGNVTLDVQRLRNDGRLAPEGLAQQTEEEFRRIKWPVLNAITRREGVAPAVNNIVLVTSAIPGEGKTFNALNLALSIARERDLDVLLVDGDVAQPSLSASVGLAGRPGVTDLLRDPRLAVEDVTYATNIAGLYLLPAGARHENAPELLSSARMETVAAELSRRMTPGVVVIDSPPILATNEAQVLTRYAGQVLLVVRADSTEQRVVTEALSLIDRNRPVSAILNRIEPSLVSRYYNHYYYGYGKGTAT
jgi:exopolysaccharide/PEP-CTERM locus tyrosine autokinase